jgi:hypothetical protein
MQAPAKKDTTAGQEKSTIAQQSSTATAGKDTVNAKEKPTKDDSASASVQPPVKKDTTADREKSVVVQRQSSTATAGKDTAKAKGKTAKDDSAAVSAATPAKKDTVSGQEKSSIDSSKANAVAAKQPDSLHAANAKQPDSAKTAAGKKGKSQGHANAKADSVKAKTAAIPAVSDSAVAQGKSSNSIVYKDTVKAGPAPRDTVGSASKATSDSARSPIAAQPDSTSHAADSVRDSSRVVKADSSARPADTGRLAAVKRDSTADTTRLKPAGEKELPSFVKKLPKPLQKVVMRIITFKHWRPIAIIAGATTATLIVMAIIAGSSKKGGNGGGGTPGSNELPPIDVPLPGNQ